VGAGDAEAVEGREDLLVGEGAEAGKSPRGVCRVDTIAIECAAMRIGTGWRVRVKDGGAMDAIDYVVF
jgi:hypothetical protein